MLLPALHTVPNNDSPLYSFKMVNCPCASHTCISQCIIINLKCMVLTCLIASFSFCMSIFLASLSKNSSSYLRMSTRLLHSSTNTTSGWTAWIACRNKNNIQHYINHLGVTWHASTFILSDLSSQCFSFVTVVFLNNFSWPSGRFSLCQHVHVCNSLSIIWLVMGKTRLKFFIFFAILDWTSLVIQRKLLGTLLIPKLTNDYWQTLHESYSLYHFGYTDQSLSKDQT